MNCRYCGNPVSENARFCRRCGKPVQAATPVQRPVERKPDTVRDQRTDQKPVHGGSQTGGKKWNNLYTVLIIAGVVVIALIIWLITGAGFGKKDEPAYHAPPADNAPADTDAPEQNDEVIFVPNDEPVDDTVNETPEEPAEGETAEEPSDAPVTNYDVESEVANIRNKYNYAVEDRASGNMIEEYVSDGITAFFLDDELKIVEVQKGVYDNYRRFFYYDNGGLYFAYYEGSDSHRLYFVDDNLIRWRYSSNAANAQEAVNYDCLDTEEYYVWMDRGLNEGYNLFFEAGSTTEYTYPMNDINMVNATSALQEYDMVHSPDRIVDDDLSTAWVEDAYGDGIYEAITVIFNSHQQVNAMVINAGYQKNEDIYYKNSRPKDITVQFSDGTSENFVLEDILGAQDVIFSYPRETYNLTIIINSVYAGNKYQDTAISEIYIY